MRIIVEARDFEVVVKYNGVEIVFEKMEDAQEFALKIMTQMGKIGY